MMRYLSSPNNVLQLLRHLVPWWTGGTLMFGLAGLWLAFYNSPPDYQQGDMVRIMYIHVPASWFAMGVYGSMALSAVIAFITKHPLPDLITRAAAPIGMGFTVISLGTGALWGKPMWGTWWVWDARLTSVLILLLLYIGYILLIESYEDKTEGLKAGRYLVMIGALNIPIIKWSVTWWTTLHQPASIIRKGGPAIDPEMLVPLFIMTIAYGLFFLLTFSLQLETEILKRKYEAYFRKRGDR